MPNSGLVDTERGGDSQYDQYTSQETSLASTTSNTKTSTGQLGGDASSTEADTQSAADKAQRGEEKAANMRYGQAISEEGFGGTTKGGLGAADAAGAGTEQGVGQDGAGRGVQGYGGSDESSDEIGG